MNQAIKFLLVEDDQALSDTIKEILSELGSVTQVYDGELGLYEAESDLYDLVVLDIMLPEKNGLDVLAELRKNRHQVPVLILTAKDSLPSKVAGFEKGADDYLTKPFYREELLMRVKALLKRSIGLFSESTLTYGNLTCQLTTNEVIYEGKILPIQGKEYDLLVYLIQNKGTILTKEQIFDRIWGFDSETTLSVIEVYMSNLRKHLKPVGLDKAIKTLRNVGYLMQEEQNGK